MDSTASGTGTRLDDLFPRWHHRERHRVTVDAPPGAVWRAVEEVTWREAPVFRVLMFIRAFGRARPPGDRTILDTMTSSGFYLVDRSDEEMVVGAIAPASRGRRSPRPAGLVGDRFRDFEQPGHTKIGFNFRYSAGLLTTETRVWLTDDRTRRRFRLYWTVIRLPSGLIRRVWLHAIRRRALAAPR
jgi:hypothetical protein